MIKRKMDFRSKQVWAGIPVMPLVLQSDFRDLLNLIESVFLFAKWSKTPDA